GGGGGGTGVRDQDGLGASASGGAPARPQLAPGDPGDSHQMTVIAGSAGGWHARPSPASAVLDQRPVPAAVERASDRPDIARGGRPDGVEVGTQRGREVDGDDAPVPAIGLQAEGTVSATAPRGANNPCPPAAPGGTPVQRGAVKARGSGYRSPARSIEPEDQWLRWAARPGRSAHRPHGAGSGRTDRVQPVARAAEPP